MSTKRKSAEKPIDPDAERQELAIHLERVVLDPKQPPKALHKAMHTGVGIDMLLELGYFDLRESFDLLRKAKREGVPSGPQVIHLFITDRFVITPQAAVDLLSVAREMVEYFQKRDLLPANLSDTPGLLQEYRSR